MEERSDHSQPALQPLQTSALSLTRRPHGCPPEARLPSPGACRAAAPQQHRPAPPRAADSSGRRAPSPGFKRRLLQVLGAFLTAGTRDLWRNPTCCRGSCSRKGDNAKAKTTWKQKPLLAARQKMPYRVKARGLLCSLPLKSTSLPIILKASPVLRFPWKPYVPSCCANIF